MGRTRHDDESNAILIVDDDPTLRRALGRILRGHGHEVLEAEDGPTAVTLSCEHRPSLLLLDYMMPGMNGEMVIAALRDELREDAPPAVLLTASGREQQRATEMGAVVGLAKPFRVQELLHAVARHRRTLAAQAC